MKRGLIAQLVERPYGIREVAGSSPAESTSGPVAQLVERYIRIVEVSGSNPLGSTKMHRCG